MYEEYLIVKSFLDFIFALFLLILLLPLMFLIAFVVKIDSMGPVFFKQKRIGRNGKVFSIYKFRTMIENAENMGTGLFNYKDDFRVTRVGKLLRLTSLDELPQLYNILMGDMSFVGPRPPVTYELGKFEDLNEEQKKRFIIKPGITGLAQISGRNELSWDDKIKLDNIYIEELKRFGFMIDLKIILLTIYKVLSMEGSYEVKNE